MTNEQHARNLELLARFGLVGGYDSLMAGVAALRAAQWRPITEAPQDRAIEVADYISGWVRVVQWSPAGWELVGSDAIYAHECFSHWRELDAPLKEGV